MNSATFGLYVRRNTQSETQQELSAHVKVQRRHFRWEIDHKGSDSIGGVSDASLGLQVRSVLILIDCLRRQNDWDPADQLIKRVLNLNLFARTIPSCLKSEQLENGFLSSPPPPVRLP